jgi:hypothetical protein
MSLCVSLSWSRSRAARNTDLRFLQQGICNKLVACEVHGSAAISGECNEENDKAVLWSALILVPVAT